MRGSGSAFSMAKAHACWRVRAWLTVGSVAVGFRSTASFRTRLQDASALSEDLKAPGIAAMAASINWGSISWVSL